MPMEEYKKSEESVQLLRDKFSQDVSGKTAFYELSLLKYSLPDEKIIDQVTDDLPTRSELKNLRTTLLAAIAVHNTVLFKARLKELTEKFATLEPENLLIFLEDIRSLYCCSAYESECDLLPLMGQVKPKLDEKMPVTKAMKTFFNTYFMLTDRQLTSELNSPAITSEALDALAIRFFKLKQDFISGQDKLIPADRRDRLSALNTLAQTMCKKASKIVNIDQFSELSKFSKEAVTHEFPGITNTVRQKQLESVTVFYQKFKAMDETLSQTVLTHLQACEADYVHILSDLSTYKTRAQEAVNAAQKTLPDTAAWRFLFDAFKIEVLQLGMPLSSKQKIQTSLEAIRGANTLVDLEKGFAFRPKSQDEHEQEAFDTMIKLVAGAKEDAYLADLLKKLQAVDAKLATGVEACFQEYTSLLPELNAAHKFHDAHEWENPLVKQLEGIQTGLVKVFRSVNQLKSAEIFLDLAYWADIKEEFEECDDAEKLEVFATKLLKIRKAIQEMDIKGEVKNTTLPFFNFIAVAVQAKITDDLSLSVDQCGASLKQFHPKGDASPGIALADRQQEMTRFPNIIECLKTLPNTIDLVAHLQSQAYLYGTISLKEYRDAVIEDINNLTSKLNDNPTWEKTLPDLMRSLFTLGMNQSSEKVFLDRLVALDKIEDLNEWLSVRVAQAPEGLDEEGAANWEDAVSFFYDPAGEKCFNKLAAQLKELEAQTEKIDTDLGFLPSPEQVKCYLDLRPQLGILAAMIEEKPDPEDEDAVMFKQLHSTLLRRFDCIVSRTANREIPESLVEVLKTYELDAFYEKQKLGVLQVKCKFCTESENVEKLAEEFAKAKEAFEEAELEGEEALRAIKHLNLIANDLLKVVAKRPETGSEDNALALFYDQSCYPGIELKERVDELKAMDEWTNTITKKQASLQADGHKDAVEAANTLLKGMAASRHAYVQGLIELPDYKAEINKSIDTAHQELDKHRGWKQFLINLTLAVLTLGVGYLAVALYQGRLFPHVATRSEQMLDDYKVAVSSMAAGAGA